MAADLPTQQSRDCLCKINEPFSTDRKDWLYVLYCGEMIEKSKHISGFVNKLCTTRFEYRLEVYYIKNVTLSHLLYHTDMLIWHDHLGKYNSFGIQMAQHRFLRVFYLEDTYVILKYFVLWKTGFKIMHIRYTSFIKLYARFVMFRSWHKLVIFDIETLRPRFTYSIV